jgi:hypothetical protein
MRPKFAPAGADYLLPGLRGRLFGQRREHSESVQVDTNPEFVAFRAFAFSDRAERSSFVDHDVDGVVAKGAFHGREFQDQSLRLSAVLPGDSKLHFRIYAYIISTWLDPRRR